jgi:type III secretion protein L
VKILVSKEDKSILDDKKSLLKEKLDQVESFAIEESADITSGSCMILTEAGNINASLDLQWKALEAAFGRFTKGA